MNSEGIIFVRVDDRMVHGIVATQFLPAYKATRAMVVNEKAAGSEIMRMSLKMAVPSGVALSVLAPEKASVNILNGNYKGQRVFIVGKFISDIYTLFKAGVKFDALDLGNCTQNDVNDPTLTVLDKTVRVNPEELAMLKEMSEGGVRVFCKFKENDPEKDCKF